MAEKKNNNKTRGIVKEREAKRLLVSWGYNVLRARGSLGVVDLVAFNGEHSRFISIKRVKGKYYSFIHEVENLKNLKTPRYSQKELWIYLDALKGRKAHWVLKNIENGDEERMDVKGNEVKIA